MKQLLTASYACDKKLTMQGLGTGTVDEISCAHAHNDVHPASVDASQSKINSLLRVVQMRITKVVAGNVHRTSYSGRSNRAHYAAT